MLMAAFNLAWDLLKALIPMEGEEGLPEHELRHYLNYMRQKEIYTPKGRLKTPAPQVMGEGAKVRSLAGVQADIDNRMGTGQGGMLQLLAEREKAPQPVDVSRIARPIGGGMSRAELENLAGDLNIPMQKAFAVLKNMGGAAGYAKCPTCNRIGPGREEQCERCKAQQSVGEGAAVADTRMRRAE